MGCSNFASPKIANVPNWIHADLPRKLNLCSYMRQGHTSAGYARDGTRAMPSETDRIMLVVFKRSQAN
jgi:hypothetical protein